MPQTIEASEKPIQDIFCDKYLFRIPSYQRPYAWTPEQATDLIEDLLDACDGQGPVADASPYFLGSIVLIKDPHSSACDVVDGQQRLTTLTILLSALRDLAEPPLASAIHGYVCQAGNPITGAGDVFRMSLRDRDADFFLKAVQTSGATLSMPDARLYRNSQARLVENTQFLRTRLLALTAAQRQRMVQFIIMRCYLVVVAASDQGAAFRIFSVLNSRGLDLSPADILKSEIIGALPAAQQEPYNQKWEQIEVDIGRERFAELFGHIRMIRRQQKMKGTLVAEFREFVPTAKAPAKFIDTELTPYAEAYEDILDGAFESYACADEINRELKHLSRLDNFDWQPPAIELIARRRSDPEFILRFLTDLERLAYGLFLVRADATQRIGRYGKLLAAIQTGDDLFPETSPLQLDKDEKKNVRNTLNGDIYPLTRVRLPLLLRLDEMLAAGSTSFEGSLVTVEHVLPQTQNADSQWLRDFPEAEVRDYWVDKLANLVLLTRRKNSQAGNLDFTDKKVKYFSTKKGIANFALTGSVLAQQAWTPAILEDRQNKLMGEIETFWRLA
jgi:hypothetical protein